MNPVTSPEWRRGQRPVQAPTLRLRDEQAPLKHCFGQFLHEKRHPVCLDDDVRLHLWRQRPAGDALGEGLDLGGYQTVENYAGDMREANPWRLVFRREGDQHQYRQGADALDRQVEHFERGRIGPVGVLEQHQDWLLSRQCFELVEQRLQGQPPLFGRAQCQRWIVRAGRDRQQGGKKRGRFRDVRRRQYGFELVELRLGRVLGGETRGTTQLHDKGVQDAVAVIGRALIL
jgi:hypothetical protein